MRTSQLQPLIEAAIFAAAAMVLDFLPSIKLAPGISVSFAMVPVFIVAFRWGWQAGFFSGFLWGILQIVTGDAVVLHPIQVLVEYLLAFAFIGVAGFFLTPIQEQLRHGRKKRMLATVVLAIFTASVARYFWHFVAGYYFWGLCSRRNVACLLFLLCERCDDVVHVYPLCYRPRYTSARLATHY